MKLQQIKKIIFVLCLSGLYSQTGQADDWQRMGGGFGTRVPAIDNRNQSTPQKYDIDLTGKMTIYGAMLTSIEKPIKADCRKFTKNDYESWMFYIEKMYYVNEAGTLVQRRRVCSKGSHLVPEEKPYYDIPIPCKTNYVAKLRPAYNVSPNGSIIACSVRIIQHIGKNMYLGSVSKGDFTTDRDYVLELENDAIPDGETVSVGLFYTGKMFSYIAVTGANRRLEVLSQKGDSGEREAKIELIEPRPPTMEEVVSHLRNGGHLLVIRPVTVKTEGTVTVIDMVNDIFDMKYSPQPTKPR